MELRRLYSRSDLCGRIGRFWSTLHNRIRDSHVKLGPSLAAGRLHAHSTVQFAETFVEGAKGQMPDLTRDFQHQAIGDT